MEKKFIVYLEDNQTDEVLKILDLILKSSLNIKFLSVFYVYLTFLLNEFTYFLI